MGEARAFTALSTSDIMSEFERIFGDRAQASVDETCPDWRRVAQGLFAAMASRDFNPGSVEMVVEDEEHPLWASKFTAVNENNVRISWREQERRLLARHHTAQKSLEQIEMLSADLEARRAEAQEKLDKASVEMALMRLTLTLRALQTMVRPAIEAGPLTVIMLAILGEASFGDGDHIDEVRANAKRTMEILVRRVSDQTFLNSLGRAIRGFVIEYDDEAGRDGALSLAAADRVLASWMGDGAARASLRETARVSGENPTSGWVFDDVSGGEGSPAAGAEGDQSEDEDLPDLPF